MKMDPVWLANFWAGVIAFAIPAYVILDGHDLGVGILFGTTASEQHRVTMMNAIAPYWDGNETWVPISLVATTFFAGQLLADYVLSPHFIGRRVNLHPVWLMFALFTFGYLFGFLGLLIAVPLAGATGVLMRFALRQYLASSLYAEAPAAEASTPSGNQLR